MLIIYLKVEEIYICIKIYDFNIYYRYIYCDDIQLELDNVLVILYVVKKYIVLYLVKLCVRFFEISLSVRNVCIFLS